MNIQEEIFRSIENIARTNSPSISLDIPTVIIGTEGDAYKVKINGVERTAKDGIGLDIRIGTPVWVHAMNGDLGSLYIMCKR